MQQIGEQNQINQKSEIEEEMCNIPDGVIKSLKDDVSEIKTALLGSKYQQKGLIERVEYIESELEILKKFKWTVYGIAMIASLLVSVIFRIIVST